MRYLSGFKRYNRETLEVRYKGKSISDVLNLTVEDAKEFFASIPKLNERWTLCTMLVLDISSLDNPR